MTLPNQPRGSSPFCFVPEGSQAAFDFIPTRCHIKILGNPQTIPLDAKSQFLLRFTFSAASILPEVEGTMSSRSSRTLYVGNLPGDIRVREVEDLFYKYGPIVDIDVKIPPRPPGYAFVEFEDPRDAEDAIEERDGYKFDGHRLRVELAHGGRRHSSPIDRYSSYSGSSVSRGPSKRSDYRVLVTGLPHSASWQDLKDHMRRAGDVCFSQVFRDRDGMTGIVDYTNYDDMRYAIRKLDDSEFRNALSRAYVRVREYDSRRSYSRSPSRSPYLSRRSYSRSYSRSPSRSRSPCYSYRNRSYSPRVKHSYRYASVSPVGSVSSPATWGLDVRDLMGCVPHMPSPLWLWTYAVSDEEDPWGDNSKLQHKYVVDVKFMWCDFG
ncbi:hypothetical protein K2173_004807 [Erythroxylum novogranatense]|uniref:RRM domain-containing protein n=1 Tax=Erythroxylum novogranatense TaxID=1862640 RepID=A0AAV8SKK1_9ROSI|nr:hypothetical protein K2173_004807 [Erythroxylum novogranatense]